VIYANAILECGPAVFPNDDTERACAAGDEPLVVLAGATVNDVVAQVQPLFAAAQPLEASWFSGKLTQLSIELGDAAPARHCSGHTGRSRST